VTDQLQPQRVRFELANGGGVLLENVCALCRDPMADGADMPCPICRRSFCIETCFGVHLRARDALDSNYEVEAFMKSSNGMTFLEEAFKVVDDDVDWRHALTCRDCGPELTAAVLRLLPEIVQRAVKES
jgi:hypothetical protein